MIRALNLIALLVAFILAAALYVVKNEVKHAQSRLLNLQAQVSEAQNEVLLLEKEEAVLESPARLARLAEQHLGMVPMTEEAKRTPEQALREARAVSAPAIAEVSVAALSPESQ